MKLTINIDCTPEEARAYMGLPDVRPLHAEMMQMMRDKMIENIKMMSPENMMQAWGPMMNQGADFFKAAMAGAASAKPAKKAK